MPSKYKLRRARQAAATQAHAAAALELTCPRCGTEPGVWCFMRGRLGPDMHERRWNAAIPKES